MAVIKDISIIKTIREPPIILKILIGILSESITKVTNPPLINKKRNIIRIIIIVRYFLARPVNSFVLIIGRFSGKITELLKGSINCSYLVFWK